MYRSLHVFQVYIHYVKWWDRRQNHKKVRSIYFVVCSSRNMIHKHFSASFLYFLIKRSRHPERGLTRQHNTQVRFLSSSTDSSYLFFSPVKCDLSRYFGWLCCPYFISTHLWVSSFSIFWRDGTSFPWSEKIPLPFQFPVNDCACIF